MNPLAARLHAALPQTQCTRCGYPDCAAYAQAIADGEAEINQCPPGGAEGIARLAALTGRPPLPLNPANGAEGPRAVAVIDEGWCIGCTLCIDACPTDAILGSNKLMHTVIEPYCTGCELCVPVCPGRLHQPGERDREPHRLAGLVASASRCRRWSAMAHAANGSSGRPWSTRQRLEAKARAKLADLPAHTHGAEGAEAERKRAVIEAALARARAKRGRRYPSASFTCSLNSAWLSAVPISRGNASRTENTPRIFDPGPTMGRWRNPARS